MRPRFFSQDQVKWMGVVPPHEFLLAGPLQALSQGNHVVHYVLVIGHDACFESFDGEREGIGNDKVVGFVWIRSAKHKSHDLDGIAPLSNALLDTGLAVHHHFCHGTGTNGNAFKVFCQWSLGSGPGPTAALSSLRSGASRAHPGLFFPQSLEFAIIYRVKTFVSRHRSLFGRGFLLAVAAVFIIVLLGALGRCGSQVLRVNFGLFRG
mmetsp:Transcript_22619/g.62952  ORF Transcript_22619/g.62952 Transcript_22619/m.62952 type:complete len:208 (+) Transcript_22619:2849-3472(+)